MDNRFLKIFILLIEYAEGGKTSRIFYETLSTKIKWSMENEKSWEFTDTWLQKLLNNCHITLREIHSLKNPEIELFKKYYLFQIPETDKLKRDKQESYKLFVKTLADQEAFRMMIHSPGSFVNTIRESRTGIELFDQYDIYDLFLEKMEKKFDPSLFSQFLHFVWNCIFRSKMPKEVETHGFMYERIMGLLEKNIETLDDWRFPDLISRAFPIWYLYLCDFSSRISPGLLDLFKERMEGLRSIDPCFTDFYLSEDASKCVLRFKETEWTEGYASPRGLVFRSYNLLPKVEVEYGEYRNFFLEFFCGNEKRLILDYFAISRNGFEYLHAKLSEQIKAFLVKTLEILWRDETISEMIGLIGQLGAYDAFANFFIDLLKDDLSAIDRWDGNTRECVLRFLMRPSFLASDQAVFPEDPKSRDLLLSAIYLKNRNYSLAKYHFDLIREEKKRLLRDEITRFGNFLEIQTKEIITDLVRILYLEWWFSDDVSEREFSKKRKYSKREFLIQVRSYLNEEQNSLSDNHVLEIAEEVFLLEEQRESRKFWTETSATESDSEDDAHGSMREKLLKWKALEKLGVFVFDYFLPKQDLEYQPGLLTRENRLACIPDFRIWNRYWDFKLGNFTDNIRETIEKILLFSRLPVNRDIAKRVWKILIIHFNGVEKIASLKEEYRETVKFVPFETILLRLENSHVHSPRRRELRKVENEKKKLGEANRKKTLQKNANALKERPALKEIICDEARQLLDSGMDMEKILSIFEKEINSGEQWKAKKWNKIEYSFMKWEDLRTFQENLRHYRAVFLRACETQLDSGDGKREDPTNSDNVETGKNPKTWTPSCDKANFFRNLRELHHCIYSKKLDVEKLRHLEWAIWYAYKDYGAIHNTVFREALRKQLRNGKTVPIAHTYEKLEKILLYANGTISLDTLLESDLFADYKKLAWLNWWFYPIETEGKYLHGDSPWQYAYTDILSQWDFSNPYERAKNRIRKNTVKHGASYDNSPRQNHSKSADSEKYNPVDREKIIWYNLELALKELEQKSWNQTMAFHLDSIVSAFRELYVAQEINEITGEIEILPQWENYVNHVKSRNIEKNKHTYGNKTNSLQILRWLLRDLLRKSPRFYKFSQKNMWSIDYTVWWAQRKYWSRLLDENMKQKLDWKMALIENDRKKAAVGDGAQIELG